MLDRPRRPLSRAVLACAAAAVLAVPAGAAAKGQFRPGDLRVCGAERCVQITDRPTLRAFGQFLYDGPQPRAGAPVARGAAYELRFRSGYVTGILGPRRPDRFLSYGVFLGRFGEGSWYVVPAEARSGLRRLTASLAPIPITPGVLARSR
jgi:hypothetical protein